MIGALPAGQAVYVFRVSLMVLDPEKVLHGLCILGVVVLTFVAGSRAMVDKLFASAEQPSWVVLMLLCAFFLNKVGEHFVDRQGERDEVMFRRDKGNPLNEIRHPLNDWDLVADIRFKTFGSSFLNAVCLTSSFIFLVSASTSLYVVQYVPTSLHCGLHTLSHSLT
jgi:hypothetical protein